MTTPLPSVHGPNLHHSGFPNQPSRPPSPRSEDKAPGSRPFSPAPEVRGFAPGLKASKDANSGSGPPEATLCHWRGSGKCTVPSGSCSSPRKKEITGDRTSVTARCPGWLGGAPDSGRQDEEPGFTERMMIKLGHEA